ncbi:hypothetical protein CWC26_17310 [Pseudoalteromonas sp. S4488]|uniref:substrate-binding domain-containing protein n=2 Tax=Pseudoalteromonas TaxID=53246 RepID=UPI0010233B9C|nr:MULTISPECIES: substrate-binding domain-containing protein [unclassified Pseudoalteromonas]RZF87165.1 hypothetical protein EXT43_03750 [Pseudoalteromonas sp. CO109Y]TMO35880.1 hypothetical protein CWC26_17310 [Pseudoalteromonas sp. S4488]TMO38764.1 hypothetical protein CWC27_02750 [Pseudoalteromonas sp. S4491]
MLFRSIKALLLSTTLISAHSAYAIEENINSKPIFIAGSTTVTELLVDIKDDLSQEFGNSIQIRPMGSDKGIKAIAENVIDIGTSSRYLTKEEQQRWPFLRQIIIAQDAIAFFVNKNLNITELTTKELSDIYQGKLKAWSEVSPYTPELSAKNDEILLFSKGTSHGSFDVFLEYLNLDYIQEPASNYIRLKMAGNRGLFSKQKVELYDQFNQALGIVQRIPNAIAYDSYGAISKLENDRRINRVTLLEIDGVSPSVESIQSGDYAFVRPLVLIVNTQSPRSKKIGDKLAVIVKSNKIQQKMLEFGYLPVKQ